MTRSIPAGPGGRVHASLKVRHEAVDESTMSSGRSLRACVVGARTPALAIAALAIAALAMAAGNGSAASGSVVVSMDVVSTTTLTNGCSTTAATAFGTMQPGASALTATGAGVCSFSFSSTNDTSQIRIGRRSGSTTAMETTGPVATLQQSTNGNAVYALHAHDASRIAMGSSGSTIRRTLDGGSTWLAHSFASGTPRDLGSDPADANNWVAMLDDGTYYKTSNFLNATPTWTGPFTIPGWTGTANAIAVASATRYWVVGNNARVAYTNDGGTSWTVYQLTTGGLPTTVNFEAVDAVDPSNVALVGTSGWTARSATGGANAAAWTTFDTGSVWFTSMDMQAANNIVAFGNDGVGEHWNGSAWNGIDVGVAATLDGSAIDPVTTTTWYVAGTNGQVLRTTDSGTTWLPLPQPINRSIEALVAPAGGTLYTLASGRNVMKSIDSGASWTNVNVQSDSETYTDIGSPTGKPLIGVAVDGDGGIDRTSNGGTTWTSARAQTGVGLNAIDFATSSTGWAVGNAGTILRTTDAGSSWAPQTSGTTRKLWSVDAISALEAVASGDDGRVYRTTNGGTTWTELVTPATVALGGVARTSSGTLLAVGARSTIVRSTNDGSSWSLLPGAGLPATNRTLGDISVTRQGSIYVATIVDDKLWKSVDDGLTWTSLPQAMASFGGMSIVEDEHVFGGDTGSDAWTSTDDSATAVESLFSGSGLWAVHALSNHSAWFGGDRGIIVKVTGSSAPAALVSDYASGIADWSTGSATSMFGMCIQDKSAQTTIDPAWTLDGDGTCTAANGPEWQQVPVLAARVGYTGAAGELGRIDVVWGVRLRSDQQKGAYHAGISVEVLAPDA